MSYAFQVDLRGIVDLLSHHLYASPRVYVRELLQNAVDAITARRAVRSGAPARCDPHRASRSCTGDGTLRVARHRHRADRGAGARVAGHHRAQLQARRAAASPGTSSSASSASACSPASWSPTRSGCSTRAAGSPDRGVDRLRRRPLRGQAAAAGAAARRAGHHGHPGAAAGRGAVADAGTTVIELARSYGSHAADPGHGSGDDADHHGTRPVGDRRRASPRPPAGAADRVRRRGLRFHARST